jgi:hypothetical protein
MEFPLKTMTADDGGGWVEIVDAKGVIICKAPGPFEAHDVMLALQVIHDLGRVQDFVSRFPIS